MNLFKYPKTLHLPWSESLSEGDSYFNTDNFKGKRVVASIKLDGENMTLYPEYIHARSLEPLGGEEYSWIKNYHSTLEIPEKYRYCGENVNYKHSIEYQNLESYFYLFSIWCDTLQHGNYCLSWELTVDLAKKQYIDLVPSFYIGEYNKTLIHNAYLNYQCKYGEKEGYVIRTTDGYKYESPQIAKYVRANHVQTTQHWKYSQKIKNKLEE